MWTSRVSSFCDIPLLTYFMVRLIISVPFLTMFSHHASGSFCPFLPFSFCFVMDYIFSFLIFLVYITTCFTVFTFASLYPCFMPSLFMARFFSFLLRWFLVISLLETLLVFSHNSSPPDCKLVCIKSLITWSQRISFYVQMSVKLSA